MVTLLVGNQLSTFFNHRVFETLPRYSSILNPLCTMHRKLLLTFSAFIFIFLNDSAVKIAFNTTTTDSPKVWLTLYLQRW